MLLPSMIAVAIFILWVHLWTGYTSLVQMELAHRGLHLCGLKNWINLFQMDRFHWDVRNLLLYAAGSCLNAS
jgi:ABC-type sugar transport system permease subunit